MNQEFNVFVLNPPFHARFSRSQRSPAVIKSGVLYYPIWLAYATGVLEKDGFKVKLVDAPASGYDLQMVLELAENLKPNLVVVETSTPSVINDLAVAEAIKSHLSQAFILFAGPHVTALPGETLAQEPALDAVARGEYDYTVRDLARALSAGDDLENVEGISYRGSDGTIVHNPDRALIQDLDALPFVSEVYKRHLRVEDYSYSIALHPQVTIVSGRGCPYKCTFCLWPQTITGPRYRLRSVANFADEFDYIAHELPQVRDIFIEDDTFTIDQERCISLAKVLIQRGSQQQFTANARANVPFDTLQWLKKAGLRLLCVGFESGDQGVLNGMKKGMRVDQYYRFREAAKHAGVLVHGCFMAGNPGETHETLGKTLQLARRLNPDTAQFYPLMVYPGTEAYDLAKSNGSLGAVDFKDWLTPEGFHNTVINQPGLPASDLVAWCDQARRSFYLRPGYLLSKAWQMLSHPGEAGRIFRSARTFSKHLLP